VKDIQTERKTEQTNKQTNKKNEILKEDGI